MTLVIVGGAVLSAGLLWCLTPAAAPGLVKLNQVFPGGIGDLSKLDLS